MSHAPRLGDTEVRPLAIGEASGNFISQQSSGQRRRNRSRGRGTMAATSPLVTRPHPGPSPGGLDELASETAALLRAIRGKSGKGSRSRRGRKAQRPPKGRRRKGRKGNNKNAARAPAVDDGGGEQGEGTNLWAEESPRDVPTVHPQSAPSSARHRARYAPGTPPPAVRQAFGSRPASRESGQGRDGGGAGTIQMMAQDSPRSAASDTPRGAAGQLAQYPPGHVMTPGVFMPGGSSDLGGVAFVGGGGRQHGGVHHGRELDARLQSSHSAIPGDPAAKQPTSARRRRERAQVSV